MPINHAWSVFASILSWYNVSSFGGLIPNLNLVRVIAVLVVEKARGGICAAIVADVIIEAVEAPTETLGRNRNQILLGLIKVSVDISIVAEWPSAS